eukprot:scaffold109682_cov24-Tisochrysis_lutea.AAC.1
MSSSAKAAATLKVHRDKMKNLEHGHAHLVWVPFSTTATTTLNLNSVWRQNKEATNWPCLLGRGAQCPSLPQHLQPSICNVYRAKIDKQGTYCTHRIVGLDALLCHGTHSPLFAHVYRAKIDQQDTCCTHRVVGLNAFFCHSTCSPGQGLDVYLHGKRNSRATA